VSGSLTRRTADMSVISCICTDEVLDSFEAGFYPCSVYYLSTCYIRYDLAFRVAIFYGCYAIAGAFSGLIAYGLLQVKGALYPWQYLFIVEGAFSE
jgi:MFS family permease